MNARRDEIAAYAGKWLCLWLLTWVVLLGLAMLACVDLVVPGSPLGCAIGGFILLALVPWHLFTLSRLCRAVKRDEGV